MRAQLLHETQGLKTYLLVFEQGDDFLDTLQRFAAERRLDGSQFTAIGAFENATLGFFDPERKVYDQIPVNEQVEVVTLAGDIALEGDEPKVHAHAVLGLRDGATLGGHLLRAQVRPTLELVLTETPATLRRRFDPATGLNLITPGDGH
jgi:predicted DNA-binding protein with PD1-like motif